MMPKLKFIALLLFVTIVSCNKTDTADDFSINFLINDQELESIGYDFNEDDLSLYKNDPDKVFFTSVGKAVVFEDVSLIEEDQERSWFLDDVELNSVREESSNIKNEYTFNTPGIYRIKLSVNKNKSITKLIKVLEVEEYQAFLGKLGKSISSEKEFLEGIGDFEVFDFTVSKEEPKTWEAIIFEDISKTDIEITRRLWDFGDGTIIPTVGTKVKYSYANEGFYEVKMCLNNTNNCKRKRVVVYGGDSDLMTFREEPVKVKESKKIAENSRPKEPQTTFKKTKHKTENKQIQKKNEPKISKAENVKPELAVAPQLRNVGFELPAKIQAGLPVRFKDLSFPDEAIDSRNWYIDGDKQYFYQRTVDYIFDRPGTYEVKMCLNRKAKNCVVKKINVYQTKVAEKVILDEDLEDEDIYYEKPKVKINYSPITSSPETGFMCQSYGKAGPQAKYKCTNDKEFYFGNAILNIIPNVDIELQNAEIYGNTDGYMDVLLLDENFEELGKIKNVQILPGYSTIEFGDLAILLEKSKKYSLLLKPIVKNNKKVGLENAAVCTVPDYINNDLNIEYVGDVKVVYDLKYCK